jgi:hypothetical protein
MFCSGCGKPPILNAKYCHNCGKCLINSSEKGDTISPSQNGSSDTLNRGKPAERNSVPSTSFSSFRARKEAERSRYFKPKAKKAKIEDKQTQEVKINVGVMILKDGRLSIKRGATLPLNVLPSITRKELLAKAFDKHSRFNTNLVHGACSEYRLLYPTMNQVINLPGTEEPFCLQRYKDEIDKPYSRITFFLCSSTDFMENLMKDSSDDDDDLLSSSTLTTSKPFSSADTASSSVSVVTIEDENTTEDYPTEDYPVCTPLSSASKGTIQCPICLDNYALDEIESHADGCSSWLLEDIYELPTNVPPTTNNSSAIPNVKNVPTNDLKEYIKQEISSVVAAEMSSEEPKRLTVRRKFIWQDFKNARQRNISPRRKVKVIFSGEPSVDEGGPRRELFSGILNFDC